MPRGDSLFFECHHIGFGMGLPSRRWRAVLALALGQPLQAAAESGSVRRPRILSALLQDVFGYWGEVF